MDHIEKEELNELLVKTAALMSVFQQECQRITSELGGTNQGFNRQIKDSLSEQRSDLNKTVVATVDSNLKQSLDNYQQSLKKAGVSLNQYTQKFDQELSQILKKNKNLVWVAWLVTFFSLILLLVGGGWLIVQYKEKIETNQVSADLMKAYNQADVSLCDGRLCVKLENITPKKYGQYSLVKNR